jgi:hypothetical protein
MIELSVEQHQNLTKNGSQPPRAHDPVTDTEYVLVRSEVYERIKTLIADDKDWPQDAYVAAMQVFARDGWDDPHMSVYDALDPRKRP